METSDCKLTFDRDYHEVCKSLRNLHRHGDLHVTALGIALGLSYQTVLGLGNSDDFLNQVIAAWLNRQDSVLSQSGEPTWSVLADKLKEIGCDGIAADIRRKNQDPQHKGQQDGNTSATLPTGTSESLIDNQQSHSSLSEQLHVPHCSDQTIVPISTVTQSTQKDLPYTSSSVMCLEQPPVPKRTKLAEESISSMSSLVGTHKFSPKLKLTKIALVKRHQKSALILEQSGNRQVCCTTTSKELESPVTCTYTRGQMLARSNQAQPIASSSLQSIVSVQALNSPLPTLPTCTISASPHQATSLTTSVASSSHSYSQTLPSVAQAELINAVEAGEAFRECRADLAEAVVDPLILANQLYSQKVISRETLKQVIELPSTVSSKNVTLLDAVEVRIRAHPSDFLIVLAILERDPTLCIYAEGLRNSYSEYPVVKQHPSLTAYIAMKLTTGMW